MPEIDDLGPGPLGPRRDQDVVGLEVAMHDALPVRRVHRVEHAREDLADLLEGHAAAPFEVVVREARPLDELHHDAEEVLLLDEVVHRDHVRMGERAQDAGLADEAPPDLAVPHQVGVQALDGHHAPERAIMRAVDHAHPALAQDVLHGVHAGEHGAVRDAHGRQRGGDGRRRWRWRWRIRRSHRRGHVRRGERGWLGGRECDGIDGGHGHRRPAGRAEARPLPQRFAATPARVRSSGHGPCELGRKAAVVASAAQQKGDAVSLRAW